MSTVHYYAIPGLKKEHKSPLQITPESIIQVICEHVNQPVEKVLGKRRFQDLIVPKYMIILFMYTYTSMNKSQIGRKLKLDHTTVIKALTTIQDRIETEEPIKNLVAELKEKILPSY